jgi:hypothetical protein
VAEEGVVHRGGGRQRLGVVGGGRVLHGAAQPLEIGLELRADLEARHQPLADDAGLALRLAAEESAGADDDQERRGRRSHDRHQLEAKGKAHAGLAYFTVTTRAAPRSASPPT